MLGGGYHHFVVGMAGYAAITAWLINPPTELCWLRWQWSIFWFTQTNNE